MRGSRASATDSSVKLLKHEDYLLTVFFWAQHELQGLYFLDVMDCFVAVVLFPASSITATYLLPLMQIKVVVGLDLIPAVTGKEACYTLDSLSLHHRSNAKKLSLIYQVQQAGYF